MEEVKLNSLQLTEIGTSEVVYTQVGYLDLSNNMIETLQGIENFPKLKSLSIQNNRIKSVEEFKKVVEKEMMRELKVKGNPLCTSVNYQIKLMEMFPKMTVLDGFYTTTKNRSFHRSTYCKLSILIIPFLKILNNDMKMVEEVIRKFNKDISHRESRSSHLDTLLETEFVNREGFFKSQQYFDTFKKLSTLKGIKRPVQSASNLRTKMSGIKRFTRRFRYSLFKAD